MIVRRKGFDVSAHGRHCVCVGVMSGNSDEVVSMNSTNAAQRSGQACVMKTRLMLTTVKVMIVITWKLKLMQDAAPPQPLCLHCRGARSLFVWSSERSEHERREDLRC